MNDIARETSAAVSGKELMRHCAEFAKRVKLSGTPEELESFRYLKSCLDRNGYRTALLSHDAYISLPGSSRVEVAGVSSKASPILFRGRRRETASRRR